ncbi:PREDICTED: serine protease HTRA2, mitochondrial isoform X2 [Wasmannia auropunctata]|uniref:serine protease HTRA2, mitochondrial isoform X2 n=1 Tax=Wasmannia auropunctata TaxID=64793 RepID=UPI0005EE14C5|nr:PREDICTED: serine protease HTRA2, mitochondrial isoform X2 [Wasmannia auropunctata]
MASPWSRVAWTSLARTNSSRCSSLSRLATLVFAERHAGARSFHSHQQQQQHRRGILGATRARKFLTCCTALASAAGLGYALYSRSNDARSWGITTPTVLDSHVVHAISPSDRNRNRDKFNFIADVVEVTAPAVVYLEIRDSSSWSRYFNAACGDFFTGRPIATSNGSGFIIRQDGLILTNAHVVVNKPNTTVKVRLYDGSTCTGTIEDIDLQGDLATVRINRTNLPVMKLGSSANIRPGEFVVAIGSPLALSNTITSGIVSSVNRPSQELGINNKQMGYIQTDAAITFGNSGGPLVNLNGEAIGINAMKVTPGISFAIPIDYAKEFLKKVELRKRNKDVTHNKAPMRRYMGITMQTLTPDIINEIQQDTNEYMNGVRHGVFVWKVIHGSPAHRAGLLPGDIVTHANGEPVLSSSNVYKMLEKSGPIKLQVLRKDQILYIQVVPENI